MWPAGAVAFTNKTRGERGGKTQRAGTVRRERRVGHGHIDPASSGTIELDIKAKISSGRADIRKIFCVLFLQGQLNPKSRGLLNRNHKLRGVLTAIRKIP
jgi:hypothetical protein